VPNRPLWHLSSWASGWKTFSFQFELLYHLHTALARQEQSLISMQRSAKLRKIALLLLLMELNADS